MRILLDECLDWRLGHELQGHDVKTAREMGWNGIQNGRLLSLAEQQFDVFITVDRNLSFQQNLKKFSIAVMILHAQSIRLVHTRPLMSKVFAQLPKVRPGTLTIVSS